jgi:hypothetical protein
VVPPPGKQGLQTLPPRLSCAKDGRGRPHRGGCGCSSGVEHNLAKVGVVGSNPIARSNSLNDLGDQYVRSEALPSAECLRNAFADCAGQLAGETSKPGGEEARRGCFRAVSKHQERPPIAVRDRSAPPVPIRDVMTAKNVQRAVSPSYWPSFSRNNSARFDRVSRSRCMSFQEA